MRKNCQSFDRSSEFEISDPDQSSSAGRFVLCMGITVRNKTDHLGKWSVEGSI